MSTLRGDSSIGLPNLSKVSWITMAVGSMAHGTTIHRVRVGAADHVDVGRVEQVVVDVVVDKVPGHRLQQHTFRQAHASFVQMNLLVGDDLAAGNAGQVADHAFDFCDLVVFQPIGELVEVVTHKCL